MDIEKICFETLKAKCKEKGLDPLGMPSFKDTLSQKEIEAKRLHYKEILQIVTHFLKRFLLSVKGVPILTTISDEKGYILRMLGDESIKNMVEQLGIREGILFTTEYNGINSVSLALNYNQPVQIIGDQHYHHFLHTSACYSIPIKDQLEDKVIGTISLMTSIDHANPLLLTLLSTVNDSIERELKLLKQNYKLNLLNEVIMDVTQNGMIISDKDGKVIGYNVYAENITGISKQEVMGKDVLELEVFGAYLQEVLNQKSQYTDIELCFVKSDGTILTFLFDALPIFDDEHTLIGAFAQFRNITERKQTERLLLNSEKLSIVGQMAASVAHEIRNPLTTIRGFIQLMEPNFSEKYYHDLLLTELDRINFIIGEFLILAKPHLLNYKKKDVLQVLQETVALFEAYAIMNNIEVQINLEDEGLPITCDENQLKQMFMNLLKNSMEAMPYGGKVTVCAWKKDEKTVVVQIKDEGCGMEQEQIESLGKPFYTTKQTGTGLGFMVIKRIVEHHQGRIHIQSKVNSGTTVEIMLPISKLDHHEKKGRV